MQQPITELTSFPVANFGDLGALGRQWRDQFRKNFISQPEEFEICVVVVVVVVVCVR